MCSGNITKKYLLNGRCYILNTTLVMMCVSLLGAFAFYKKDRREHNTLMSQSQSHDVIPDYEIVLRKLFRSIRSSSHIMVLTILVKKSQLTPRHKLF